MKEIYEIRTNTNWIFDRDCESKKIGKKKKKNKTVRQRGIEPLAKAWEASMLPLHHWRIFRSKNTLEFFGKNKIYKLLIGISCCYVSKESSVFFFHVCTVIMPEEAAETSTN